MQNNKYILAIILASLFFFVAVFSLSSLYDQQNRPETPITDNPDDFPETFDPEIDLPYDNLPPELEEPNQPTYPEVPTKPRNPKTYTCPTEAWINCMPPIDQSRAWECSSDYLQWADKSCPGFEGAAY